MSGSSNMSGSNKPDKQPQGAAEHIDELLDEALRQTFPASDAVAIDVEHVPHKRDVLAAPSSSKRARSPKACPAQAGTGLANKEMLKQRARAG
jgi:hypothetical protein